MDRARRLGFLGLATASMMWFGTAGQAWAAVPGPGVTPSSQATAAPPAGPAQSMPPPPLAPLPPPIAEDDEMLVPLGPASHVVGSWDEALSSLRARSTDLRIALDEIERSDAGWRASLAASLPQLTGSGNVTANLLRDRPGCVAGDCSLVPNGLSYGASVTLSQPLFAPRAWHAARTAKMGIDVSRLEADEQKRLLTIALANALVSVVTGERISEINRVGLRASLDRLTLARRRVALGAGTALDTVRADQDVSVARSAVVTGDESLRQAREGLGLALGSNEPWGVPPDINLNGVEASARSSCVDAGTLEDRADIAAARGNTEIARRNIDDAKLRTSPTLDVVSSFGLIGSRGDLPSQVYPSGLHEAWTIAGVLTIPFYDGGARYAAVRESRALADEAAQRLEAARRSADVQVAQARRAVNVADQNRRVAERARDLARETERLSRIAFQAGTGTSLDLIESGRRLREAEIQLALQEFGFVRATIASVLTVSRCRW